MTVKLMTLILEVLAQIILIDKLSDKRSENRYFYVVLYGSISVFSASITEITNFSVLLYAATIFYIKLNYRLTWKKSIIIFIVCSFIISVFQLLFMMPFVFLKKQVILDERIQLFINIETIIFIFLLRKKVNSTIIAYFLGKENKMNRIAAFLCGIILIYGLAIYKYWKYLKIIDYILILIFGITVGLLIYLWQRERYERQKRENELTIRKLYEETFKDLIDNIRSKQHEFNNHLTVLQSQTKICRNYEELACTQESYITELRKENKEFYKLLILDNHILAGLLYSKLLKAKKQGIDIEYHIEIENLKLNLAITKIVEVISILLDNAIAKLEELREEERKIKVFIKEEKGLFIEAANCSEYISNGNLQQFFKKGYTTKGKEHGYGLYNLKNIVTENKGEISVKNKKIEGKNYIVFQIKVY